MKRWITIHSIVALAEIVLISINGLGIRERLFAFLLSLYEISVAHSVAFSLFSFTLGVSLILLFWIFLEVVSYTKAR